MKRSLAGRISTKFFKAVSIPWKQDWAGQTVLASTLQDFQFTLINPKYKVISHSVTNLFAYNFSEDTTPITNFTQITIQFHYGSAITSTLKVNHVARR